MKILFCWTGVTSYMADCWRALQAVPGVELKVIVETADSGKSFNASRTLYDLDHVLVDRGEWRSPRDCPATFRPDVLFAGGWRSRTTRQVLACHRDVPKVFCLDMPWRRSLRCLVAPLFLRGFLRSFKSVYVPGASTAFYARWLGFRKREIVKGLYAVDQARFRNAGVGREMPSTGFLFVGRYSPEKRRDLVEAAYARYRALGGTWPIDYYGQGGQFAQASEMPGVYAAHACLVLASAFDPWPLVMLEARSAGLEVIASDRCGNVDELGAVKVRYGDVEAMARAMLEVERGKRVARTQDLSHYDVPSWVARTLALAQRTLGCEANGMMVVDRLLREHGMIAANEVWVHGMWTVDKWIRCVKAKLGGKKLVRMTHGSLSPVYLRYQSAWKKRLVKPVEKMLFAMSDRIVATGPWEVDWARGWGLRRKIDVIDLKTFFGLGKGQELAGGIRAKGRPLHVLYLGRRHPLKGTAYLERAVEGLKDVELREVADHFGEALEQDWAWCDVLCLPTLSENFGLVVAEALQRGKRVITTDGAPAWENQPGVTYLRGYRDGTDETRVGLLRAAIRNGRRCGSSVRTAEMLK